LREGGRTEPFNFDVPYPTPVIPRSLTYEIPGRIRPDGSEFAPLGEQRVIEVLREIRARKVEAIAVTLLWSIVNPRHEERVAELIEQHLPGLPYTLSHRLNPSIREFRRACSTAIDASLKPLMDSYMSNLQQRLGEAGFTGRVLIVTSQAGVIDSRDARDTPIRIVNSGPSMAPVAGRWFGQIDEQASTIVVADTGGTTYDVSLVRKGVIPVTRDTWIGPQYSGLMVGFPWVDVRSIGAGGGSIARVDSGGLLHVGPQSAGANPGPVCYGRGGTLPTVSDASVVLGHLDPKYFLGGSMSLDEPAAAAAIRTHIAEPLGIGLAEAASAILAVATENMVQAIVDITVNQGIDPREAVLIGGGGAAGLNSVKIARRLGCRRLVIPVVGAALSAAGALMSDLRADYSQAFPTNTRNFDFSGVNRVLDALRERCRAFALSSGAGSTAVSVHLTAEARYATQVWEIETAVPCETFSSREDVRAFEQAFHHAHAELFTFADPDSPVEIINWTAHVVCALKRESDLRLDESQAAERPDSRRRAYFERGGWSEVDVYSFRRLPIGRQVAGPAIVENAFTTIVIDPGAVAVRRASGSLSVDVGGMS